MSAKGNSVHLRTALDRKDVGGGVAIALKGNYAISTLKSMNEISGCLGFK